MKPDTGHFEMHRSFPVTLAQLWHLVTDIQMRKSWAIPDPDMPMTCGPADLRVGGVEREFSGDPDAPEFLAETRWYHLAEPSDAAFTETLDFGGMSAATSLVTYRLVASDKGSALWVSVAVSSFTGPDTIAEMQKGWESSLDNLSKLAAG